VSEPSAKRLPFIDFARGVVMIIMAWDHASTFWNPLHQGAEGLHGLAPRFANLTQFLLRFVTHYAAPTFIFLAGTSLAISTANRAARGHSPGNIGLHLVIRGIVLLVLEMFLVSAAFGLPPFYFGVIACIGVCLILFSVIRFMPAVVIGAGSLILIIVAPFIDLGWIPDGVSHPAGHYLRVILAEPRFDLFPFVGLYPVIPWIGVMGLGWVFGLYLRGQDANSVQRLTNPLLLAGVGMLVVWFIIRLVNGYGNLLLRSGADLQSWLYMSKYPPSLAFLLWTLVGTAFFLAIGLIIQRQGWLQTIPMKVILVYGRTPLFFYVLHLWVYRLSAEALGGLVGRGTVEAVIVWAVGLILLWWACRYYGSLKRRHPRSVLQYI